MRFTNCQVLSGSDSASVSGIQIDANQLIAASFQAIFGDTSADGTLFVQASNDIDDISYQSSAGFTVTNWVNIPGATATVTNGVVSPITISNVCYRWMRVMYTSNSGGSTTVVVHMFAQSL